MNADNDLAAGDTDTENKLHQPNQMEDGIFSSQSPTSRVPIESLDYTLSSHPINQYENNETYLQTGIEHAAVSNPNDSSNLDESVFQHSPPNQNTLGADDVLCLMDDLHVVNCQAQSEHSNGASSSAVEVEAVQLPKPIKSLFRRSQNKKGKSRFSEAAKSILKSFYSNNPYPEKNDVTDLAHQVKLTPKQIRVWFSNKRNRENSPGKPLHPLYNNKSCF